MADEEFSEMLSHFKVPLPTKDPRINAVADALLHLSPGNKMITEQPGVFGYRFILMLRKRGFDVTEWKP